jgi:hypothetical protein
MAAPWRETEPSRRLARREDVQPLRTVPLEGAQAEVNFVVFAPRSGAAGRTTLRPEQPPGRPDALDPKEIGQTPWSEANPCSLRTTLREAGRAVRMKQFLYDWAPPAAGVAPLWGTPQPRPHECEGSVAWTGADYRGRAGACVQRERTQIELSVVEGEWRPEELVGLLCELAPVSGADEVRAAGFHELNYWVRYRLKPYRVPIGLWRYGCTLPYDRRDGVVCRQGPSLPGLAFDSAFALEDGVEIVWRGPAPVVLLAARAGCGWAPPVPPEPEGQAAEVRERRPVGARDGWLAGLTRRYGGWEYRWEEDGYRCALLASPSPGGDEGTFLAQVAALRSEHVREWCP